MLAMNLEYGMEAYAACVNMTGREFIRPLVSGSNVEAPDPLHTSGRPGRVRSVFVVENFRGRG